MNTNLDNPDVSVRDERIVTLDKIVSEVKESEEEFEQAKADIAKNIISKGTRNNEF